MTDNHNLKFLEHIAREDIKQIIAKDGSYGSSWKKRGGVGAFMMMARKWDRIEKLSADKNYDIFSAIGSDTTYADSTVLAEVRDLRTYLMLVESEILARHGIRKTTVEDRKEFRTEEGVSVSTGHPAPFGYVAEEE